MIIRILSFTKHSIPILLLVFSFNTNADLDIYHIDVEQGDSTLFVTSTGATLLVDSGKNGHGGRIKSIMEQARVTHLRTWCAV